MLSVDRINSIKQILQKSNSVTVADLAEKFYVSSETIRRDLQKICDEDPMIIKVHGGAYRILPDADPPYAFREGSRIEEKKRIAMRAFEEIDDGDYLMLDGSTTTLYLSKLIAAASLHVTVISNSTGIINELITNENINVIGIGGRYTDATHSFVGAISLQQLSGLFAVKAFVSCSGIDIDNGITHNSEEEAAIRRMMLKNSRNRYLLLDGNKFGRCKAHKIIDLNTIDKIFTEMDVDAKWDKLFKANGIELVRCE